MLVAEDNPVNQRLIDAFLGKSGIACDIVADGEAALRALGDASYDLALMDCQMPVVDGYEATRRIRERERLTGGRRLPIIAVTAHALPGERERCMEVEMDAYLAKPYRPNDLYRLILDQLAAAADRAADRDSDVTAAR